MHSSKTRPAEDSDPPKYLKCHTSRKPAVKYVLCFCIDSDTFLMTWKTSRTQIKPHTGTQPFWKVCPTSLPHCGCVQHQRSSEAHRLLGTPYTCLSILHNSPGSSLGHLSVLGAHPARQGLSSGEQRWERNLSKVWKYAVGQLSQEFLTPKSQSVI